MLKQMYAAYKRLKAAGPLSSCESGRVLLNNAPARVLVLVCAAL